MSLKRGFTLIELLVVIAIVAILAANLFPVFAQAREKARQTACASNLKQLGLAFVQYIQDYDEIVPFGVANDWPYGANGWAGEVYPYIKSTAVFACPDDPTSVPTGNSVISYAYNSNVEGDDNYCGAYGVTDAGGFTYEAPRNVAKFTSPPMTVLLYEFRMPSGTGIPTAKMTGGETETGQTDMSPASNERETACFNAQQGCEYGGADTGPFDGHPAVDGGYAGANNNFAYAAKDSSGDIVSLFRHGSGANYLLFDGHVKFLASSKVAAGRDANSPAATATADQSAGTSGVLASGAAPAVTFSVY